MLKHQVYQLWSYPLPLSTPETLNPKPCTDNFFEELSTKIISKRKAPRAYVWFVFEGMCYVYV